MITNTIPNTHKLNNFEPLNFGHMSAKALRLKPNRSSEFLDGEVVVSLGNTIKEARKKGKRADAEINKLVLSYRRLGFSLARKFINSGMQFEDLIQEANLGLIIAAEKFDPKRNNNFLVYASKVVIRTLINAITDKGSIIKNKSHILRKRYELGQVVKRLNSCLANNPSSEELLKSLDKAEAKLVRVRSKIVPRPLSFETPIKNGYGDLHIGDCIPTTDDSAGVDPVEFIQYGRLQAAVGKGLDKLAPEVRQAVKLVLGFNDDQEPLMKLKAAEVLGCNRNTVYARINAAYKALRPSLEPYNEV